MSNETRTVIELVADVLNVSPETIPPDASMESVSDWDSLAQLNICMLIEERFGVDMDMETIAASNSIPALVAVVSRR